MTNCQEIGKICSLYRGFIQCSYSFQLFKFHDFFHDLFKFSKTLGLAVSLKKFTNFPCCRVFFDLQQFNRHKLWCPPQCMPFALLNYSFLSCIVLALASAVTNFSNKTLIFHDFQGPKIKFHDFPGLKNEILKIHDFPGFPCPARTLSLYQGFLSFFIFFIHFTITGVKRIVHYTKDIVRGLLYSGSTVINNPCPSRDNYTEKSQQPQKIQPQIALAQPGPGCSKPQLN